MSPTTLKLTPTLSFRCMRRWIKARASNNRARLEREGEKAFLIREITHSLLNNLMAVIMKVIFR